MKKEKEIPAWEELSPDDRMKYEIGEDKRLALPLCQRDRSDRRSDDKEETDSGKGRVRESMTESILNADREADCECPLYFI